MARDPGDLSPLCSRSLELRAFTFIHGRKAVYHHGVRHRLRLYGGAVPDDAQTFAPRNLQHDRPRRVNLIAANASSGESTETRVVINKCSITPFQNCASITIRLRAVANIFQISARISRHSSIISDWIQYFRELLLLQISYRIHFIIYFHF